GWVRPGERELGRGQAPGPGDQDQRRDEQADGDRERAQQPQRARDREQDQDRHGLHKAAPGAVTALATSARVCAAWLTHSERRKGRPPHAVLRASATVPSTMSPQPRAEAAQWVRPRATERVRRRAAERVLRRAGGRGGGGAAGGARRPPGAPR